MPMHVAGEHECGQVCGHGAPYCQCCIGWAEAHIKIARMTLTVKLDRNWSSFQLANSAPPLSVTDSAIAPSARMHGKGMESRIVQACE